MNKVLKIVNLIISSLLALLPLIEKFFQDDEATKKIAKNIFESSKELRFNIENKISKNS